MKHIYPQNWRGASPSPAHLCALFHSSAQVSLGEMQLSCRQIPSLKRLYNVTKLDVMQVNVQWTHTVIKLDVV